MTDAGKQPGHEDAARAIGVEPMVCRFDFLVRQQHVAAVALDERAPELPGDPVADRRSGPRSSCSGQYYSDEIEPPLRRPERRGRQHDLGRNRQRGALEEHHHEDAEVSPVEDKLHPGGEKMMKTVQSNQSSASAERRILPRSSTGMRSISFTMRGTL